MRNRLYFNSSLSRERKYSKIDIQLLITMPSIYFGFFCQFIFLLTRNAHVVVADHPKVLELTITPEKTETLSIVLKQTSQLLANKHLPVWITNENPTDPLLKLEKVMQRMGPFTCYQDTRTSTAAVLFETQQKMRGIIDTRAVIERTLSGFRLLSDPLFLARGIKHRSPSRFFQAHPQSGSQYNLDWNGKSEVTRIHRDALNRNYVEILVLVSYDMVLELQPKPNDYSPIVSYVLTLFNNVDMLYAKIEDPPIILNVAGIIIAKTREAFPLHSRGECNEKIENNDGILEDDMDIRCTNAFIRRFCDEHAKIIPPGTYDVAILLTRYGLHQNEYNARTGDRRLKKLGGLAESPKDGYYNRMKLGTMLTLVATISDRGEYESFPIIAHEITHLFDVEHDEPTGETNKIMRARGKHTSESLSWSRASVASMRKFFESRDACIFKNFPVSLLKPGPHKIWDADRQCRCYRYDHADNDFFGRLRRTIKVDCDSNIMCKDSFGEVHEGPVYRDGTPCNQRKVCWAGECVNSRK